MITTETSHRVINQADILRSLIRNPAYPFACWQMPGERETTLIVSLNDTSICDQSLNEVSPGFIVNPFGKSHPVQPTLIPADVCISGSGKLQQSSQVSDRELDQFLNNIQTNSPSTSAKPQYRVQKNTQVEATTFQESVQVAIDSIRSSTLDKIVLSRFEDFPFDDTFSIYDFYQRITQSYPSAFCNIWSMGDGTIWIGATPETLIEQEGALFKTVSLAGTQPLMDEPVSNISWKQKEIEEQALVSRYIINCFKKLRIREFEEYGPKTIAAGTLAHLITTYQVNTAEIRFEGLADAMVELLHPTSAVCGMPMDLSLDFIKKHEHYDREFYSGFIGPVNMLDKTHLFVNLRCMKISDSVARIYAGAGITEDSDPLKEYEETVMKMDVMKSKLSN